MAGGAQPRIFRAGARPSRRCEAVLGRVGAGCLRAQPFRPEGVPRFVPRFARMITAPLADSTVNARTSSANPSSQVSVPRPSRSSRRSRSSVPVERRASSRGRPAAGRRRAAPYSTGWGSQDSSPGPKPYDGTPPSHGHRHATAVSARGGAVRTRRRSGPGRASSGSWVASGRPSSSPWKRYADPGSASITAVAARARRSPSAASGCASSGPMPSVFWSAWRLRVAEPWRRGA